MQSREFEGLKGGQGIGRGAGRGGGVPLLYKRPLWRGCERGRRAGRACCRAPARAARAATLPLPRGDRRGAKSKGRERERETAGEGAWRGDSMGGGACRRRQPRGRRAAGFLCFGRGALRRGGGQGGAWGGGGGARWWVGGCACGGRPFRDGSSSKRVCPSVRGRGSGEEEERRVGADRVCAREQALRRQIKGTRPPLTLAIGARPRSVRKISTSGNPRGKHTTGVFVKEGGGRLGRNKLRRSGETRGEGTARRREEKGGRARRVLICAGRPRGGGQVRASECGVCAWGEKGRGVRAAALWRLKGGRAGQDKGRGPGARAWGRRRLFAFAADRQWPAAGLPKPRHAMRGFEKGRGRVGGGGGLQKTEQVGWGGVGGASSAGGG